MNDELYDIRQMIIDISFKIRFERSMYKPKALCHDYDGALDAASEAKEQHEQLIEQLINRINNYINYKADKFLIFNIQSSAGYRRYSNPFDSSFCGYVVKVPFEDKQEYYCIKHIFDEIENTKVMSLNDNEWWIYV